MKTNHESAAAARRYYAGLTTLTGSVTAAGKKWSARQANRPLPPAAEGRFAALHAANQLRRSRAVKVPLGSLADDCLPAVKKMNKRLREWSLGAEEAVLTKSHSLRESGSNSDWNKRSTFRRGVWIQSQATCTRSMARLVCFGDEHKITAPRGYRWDIDVNGLVLIGAAGEYHPSASELIDAGKDRCRGIVESLKQSAAARRVAKAKQKQQLAMLALAEKEGATVCLADSKRAGNCVAGSKTWAERHGLDPRKHYTPSQILAQANGDASRVTIVVAAAIRRHRQEMDRGFAILAEHQA